MGKNKNGIFKQETIGTLMKKDFIALSETDTVEQAIKYVRENVGDKTNIHYLYIVSPDKQLKGVLSIRELLGSSGELPLVNIMTASITSFSTDLDQEKAIKVFQDKNLVSVPVLNNQKQMVGVIHVEDILDVMQQETTEDFHKMAPVSGLNVGLKDAGISLLYRKRIVWLVLLVFMNVFSGAGIAFFEEVIEANLALVFFLPLLVDSGGNAGAQAATLVIRSMALGEVKMKDWVKMFTKEISVSILLGITMALAVASVGLFRGGPEIALVVALTMVIVVIVGSLIGMSLPFIFNKLKLDPATASGPLITSIADIVGVLIYFSIAAWILAL
ncbi:magnesium transporter [Sporosarcina limicola]|uniref:Magnesium transporter MgtE n=1 Tax=Sporosarcina limicola TaxID=34101 RepID=A0A927MNB4_9BACL|nr:magnesium transporter [Sporosarcina limicola]MBE1557113.1 magnesium transporter [Sporosarcina limicola]